MSESPEKGQAGQAAAPAAWRPWAWGQWLKVENKTRWSSWFTFGLGTDHQFDIGPNLTAAMLGFGFCWVVVARYRARAAIEAARARLHTPVATSQPGKTSQAVHEPPGKNLQAVHEHSQLPKPASSLLLRLFRGCGLVGLGALLTRAAVTSEGSSDEGNEAGDGLENPKAIKGSQTASVTKPWREIRLELAGKRRAEARLGLIELGGVRWHVVAQHRGTADELVGFYLQHRQGSKDQIAFTLRIIGIPPGEETEKVLEEERHPGSWVVAKLGSLSLAADGKGCAVEVSELETFNNVRIEFRAHGPATKHEGAI